MRFNCGFHVSLHANSQFDEHREIEAGLPFHVNTKKRLIIHSFKLNVHLSTAYAKLFLATMVTLYETKIENRAIRT